jgi:lipopolysaccharide biosynthesis glycosyltransferase
MVDNPYFPGKEGKCLDGHEKCEDCRLQKPENVASAHFTLCQKPWTCTKQDNPKNMVLCAQLHEKWFQLRNELEIETHVDLSYRAEKTAFKESMGMCSHYGESGYKRIPLKEGLTT